MKIVVTGATGFVGRPIVEKLLARGDHVLALSRDAERARASLAKLGAATDAAGRLEVVSAHLEEPGEWQKAFAGCDAVLHLAGESIGGKKWDARQKQILRDSRVESTRHLVEAIGALPASQRPKTLVSASGIDYYGFSSTRGDDFDDDEVTETDPPGTSFLARLCRDWEKEALAAQAHGLRVACMRCAIVLGPPGGALDKMTTPFKFFVGGRIGNGYQFFSWIHRDDAVQGYLAALDDARYTGGINLVTASTRNREFSKALGNALGKPSWLPVPAFAVKIAAGEFAEYVLNGRNAVPAKLRELDFRFARPTLDEALSDVK
jgi:uncharacterized protein (TIGR01777 family)